MARKTGSHSDITGPRIKDAALRLFAQQGYAAVSMRKIASEVGVQAGALYLYTPDKQTLLFELMQTHMIDLLAAWEGLTSETGVKEQLDAFVRFHIGFNLDRPDAVFISYMELRNLSEENRVVITGLRKQYENVLEDILRRGKDTGDFTVADPQLAAMAMIAMLTGVNTWYREGGRLSRKDIEEIYLDMARRAVSA